MAELEVPINAEEAEQNQGPKPPLDFSYLYSRTTAARKESTVKEFYKYFAVPGIGNLAGGLPNASLFPFDTLEAQTAQPNRFTPTPTPSDPNEVIDKLDKIGLDSRRNTSTSTHITVPHTSAIADPLQKIDLTTALQYGQAQGYPPLHSFLRQFTRENLHPNVPYLGGPEIVLTNGNTDGLAKVLECFSNPWNEERDWIRERPAILCEEFTFMNAIQAAKPRGLQVVPVKVDHEGMLHTGEGGLEEVLKNWDDSKGKRPHLMYTVTVGQNPTSGTLSLQRRKDIYNLCSKYDVIIIEDDPYWYLQFPSAAKLEAETRTGFPPSLTDVRALSHGWKSSGHPFLDSLEQSSLNIDQDGRVIRLDTFSKTVAPGCRLGWITAQPAIIERILRITETSTQQPSGFVQSLISELIMGAQPTAMQTFKSKSRSEQLRFTGWKVDGWVQWLAGLRGVYERRMNRMCHALEDGCYILKHKSPSHTSTSLDSDWAVISKKKIYSFHWPSGGMFIWIKVHFSVHPLAHKIPGPRLARLLWIFLTMKPHLVLSAPGAMFSPTEQIRDEKGWQFYRICFAAVTEEEVEKSSKRFAEGVQAFWRIRDKDEMEDIEPSQDSLNSRSAELVDLAAAIGGAC